MLLELDGVNAYYDKSHILQDVSLAVEAGEVVALLGRNGSGRSTTCKTIMGLVTAKSGTIRFKGQIITNKSPFALAQLGIAFVPEDRRIFPNLTVGENLRLAPECQSEDHFASIAFAFGFLMFDGVAPEPARLGSSHAPARQAHSRERPLLDLQRRRMDLVDRARNRRRGGRAGEIDHLPRMSRYRAD